MQAQKSNKKGMTQIAGLGIILLFIAGLWAFGTTDAAGRSPYYNWNAGSGGIDRNTATAYSQQASQGFSVGAYLSSYHANYTYDNSDPKHLKLILTDNDFAGTAASAPDFGYRSFTINLYRTDRLSDVVNGAAQSPTFSITPVIGTSDGFHQYNGLINVSDTFWTIPYSPATRYYNMTIAGLDIGPSQLGTGIKVAAGATPSTAVVQLALGGVGQYKDDLVLTSGTTVNLGKFVVSDTNGVLQSDMTVQYVKA